MRFWSINKEFCWPGMMQTWFFPWQGSVMACLVSPQAFSIGFNKRAGGTISMEPLSTGKLLKLMFVKSGAWFSLCVGELLHKSSFPSFPYWNLSDHFIRIASFQSSTWIIFVWTNSFCFLATLLFKVLHSSCSMSFLATVNSLVYKWHQACHMMLKRWVHHINL